MPFHCLPIEDVRYQFLPRALGPSSSPTSDACFVGFPTLFGKRRRALRTPYRRIPRYSTDVGFDCFQLSFISCPNNSIILPSKECSYGHDNMGHRSGTKFRNVANTIPWRNSQMSRGVERYGVIAPVNSKNLPFACAQRSIGS